MAQLRGHERLAAMIAVFALVAMSGHAQEAEETPAAEEAAETSDEAETAAPRQIEEIIVVAPKPGSRRDVDSEYEDPVRAKLLKDFYRMKELDEESAWRSSGADDSSSRIKLGYDPRDEYRMRNDTSLQELSWEKNKPATVFRFEF